jgi:hypothetical protein
MLRGGPCESMPPVSSNAVTAVWERAAAAGGIVFVGLQLVSQGLMQIGGVEPSFDASADEILAFFEARHETLFALGTYLSLVSFVVFLWFLGALWAALSRAEGRNAWLSLVAFASGLAFLAALSGGWYLAVFRIDDGLDPQVARLAFDMGNLGFANSWVPLASLLLAASVVILGTGALPRWLGWLGLVAGVALLAARIVWTSPVAFAPYALSWVWLVAISVILIRRAGTRPVDEAR